MASSSGRSSCLMAFGRGEGRAGGRPMVSGTAVAPHITSGQHLILLGRFVTPENQNSGDAAANSQSSAPEADLFRASFSYGL